GKSAAQVASGMGSEVCILDANASRVANLSREFAQDRGTSENVKTAVFSTELLLGKLADCDLLIGATLMAGEHAAHLLNAEYLASMNGGVFIDIAIDQGGISETSRATTYADPVYLEAGVLHCCLPNLPACVPLSATRALTHATFPFIQLLADEGIEAAVRGNAEVNIALARGVNTWDGHITHPGVAHAMNQTCTALSDLFKA
ncbi:MAG: alanine dehydrogenase, partial [Mariprofundaceae bacterium]|nr:alanine dehydrogenase [Mariprofundaceae bacterium]